MSSKLSRLFDSNNINDFASGFAEHVLSTKKPGSLTRIISAIIENSDKIENSDNEADLKEHKFFMDCLKHIAGHPDVNHTAINWQSIINEIVGNYFVWGGNDDLRAETLKTFVSSFRGFDINKPTDDNGFTILMSAMGGFNTGEKLVNAIIDLGADINKTSKIHGKAIHFFYPGQQSIYIGKLNALLQRGADPFERLSFKAYVNRNNEERDAVYTSFMECIESREMYDAVELVMKHCAAADAHHAASSLVEQGLVDKKTRIGL